MCIAIFKPANTTISKETLEQCFRANSDGAGFMVANEDKTLTMMKGFFTFNEFYEAYLPHENKPAAIHFRIRTHGKLDADNCHPFLINKGFGFIHNGVISGFGAGDKSDTNEFNEQVMQKLVGKYGNNILSNETIKALIEARIGYSKFVLLDRHGNHQIYNEMKGIWDNGVWYSNTSYKPFRSVSYPNGYDYTTGKTKTTMPAKTVKPMTLSEGTLVELIAAVWDPETKELFKAKELFEVVAVNSDYTADLMHVDKDVFLYNVSYVKFDIFETTTQKDIFEDYNYETTLPGNWGI